jgi:hypothetical protein
MSCFCKPGDERRGVMTLMSPEHEVRPRQSVEAYLRFLFGRIPDDAINRIDEFAPWAVADQIRTAV